MGRSPGHKSQLLRVQVLILLGAWLAPGLELRARKGNGKKTPDPRSSSWRAPTPGASRVHHHGAANCTGENQTGSSLVPASGSSSDSNSNASLVAGKRMNPDDCIDKDYYGFLETGAGNERQNSLRGGGGAGSRTETETETQECHQCYTACSGEAEAYENCKIAFYLTCDAGQKALSFCRCEEGGWDYPYINPGGRPGGERSWRCCFSHKCDLHPPVYDQR